MELENGAGQIVRELDNQFRELHSLGKELDNQISRSKTGDRQLSQAARQLKQGAGHPAAQRAGHKYIMCEILAEYQNYVLLCSC